jgi:hypothetical protein
VTVELHRRCHKDGGKQQLNAQLGDLEESQVQHGRMAKRLGPRSGKCPRDTRHRQREIHPMQSALLAEQPRGDQYRQREHQET